MFVTALLLGLVGVFCILDSRILGRMNFERPLITCTIVGALLGDLQTGLTLGASIELMSLGIVNIGAAAPPDMNMAAIICAAFAILTDASAETALALAIPIAVLGQMLGVLMRTILSNLTHVADHAIAEGKFRKAWSMHIVWGTVLYSLMYFIPIFLSVYFGTDLVQKIVAFIPAWLTDGLNLGSKFLTAYGIAAVHHAQPRPDRLLPAGLLLCGLSGSGCYRCGNLRRNSGCDPDRSEVWQGRTRRSRCRCSCCQPRLRPAGR